MQLGNPAAAIDPMSRAIALNGTNPEFHYNLGLAFQAMGDRDSAIAGYRRASELKPDYGDALTNLGNLLLNVNELADAEDCYRRLIRFNASNPVAHNNLGAALLRRDEPEDAADCFREALRLEPRYAAAHNGLGTALLARDLCEEADACFRESLKINPQDARAHNNLGLALSGQGRFGAAVDSFREALGLAADYIEAHINLGNMYFEQDSLDDAEHCFRDALRLKPEYIKPRFNLANVFVERDEFDQALEIFDDLLGQQPGAVNYLVAKAHALDRRGSYDAAYAIIRPLVDSGSAGMAGAALFGNLAPRFNCRDEAVTHLENLLSEEENIEPETCRALHFSLGKLYDGLDAFDDAFRHYAEGNELRPTPYDPDKAADDNRRAIAFFSRERLASIPRTSVESDVPVFIVGMPRSGTSLVEQILACHPDVTGAGELGDVPKLAISLVHTREDPDAADTMPLPAVDQEAVDAAARKYLDRLHELGGDSIRVTDKQMYNFQHLGLITRLFPGARIIHCERDPIDTCLSEYFQNFKRGNFFTFDLEHLGRYYVQYRRLMGHWREVLDTPILEINYERHVADPEGTCRRMLDFLDLEWDPKCLEFHESKRVTKTASRDQVRQPIYTRSAGRWRNYESHLEPLKRALADSS